MSEEGKENVLPEQTGPAILKYLTDGAPGMFRGDRVELVTRSWGSIVGGWIASDRYGVMVEAGPNGIESVPLDQVLAVKKWQGADNSWPGCWCQTDSSICGMAGICSQTKHLSEKWIPTSAVLQGSYSISFTTTKPVHT